MLLIEKLNGNIKNADRANCFNAVELFFDESKPQKFMGPQDFVEYVNEKFSQIPAGEKDLRGDVTIVWSRSASELPPGEISIERLAQKQQGYPFGLVIEHAFVILDDNNVFEKPDPKATSNYRIVTRDEALGPYLNIFGFEITRYRRR